jgi:protein O-GlcNAc transferase
MRLNYGKEGVDHAISLFMTIPQALQTALQHHQAGRVTDAEALYRQILAVQPKNPDALHLLGMLARQLGRHESAADLIRQAIAVNPADPRYYLGLGSAELAQGRLDEAISAYRTTLQLKPGVAVAHSNLGAALREKGCLDEAVAECRHALRIKPDYAEAWYNLGLALQSQGHLDDAVAAYRSALRWNPNLVTAQNNLGIVLKTKGDLDGAVEAYQLALQIKPDYAEALINLGSVLQEQGRLDEAVVLYRRALQAEPDSPEAHNNLGDALAKQGQLDEAVAVYHQALRIKPDLATAHYGLGIALQNKGHLDEAVAAYGRALELQPEHLEALNNLGNALKDRGELDEAISSYRRALKVRPGHAGVHSNVIYTLHFHPGGGRGRIAEEHQNWNRQFSDPLKPFVQPHANDRNPNRRLRVGYVSPDFLDHAIARFALPLLEHHDRERFEILCYSGVVRPNSMTERFRALAGEWRNTVGVSDARLAETIREDGVDILVDLTMHAARNRLPVFARHPAPVQVSWLAYPGSTGLDSINYRLTDACMDPPGERPAWSAEEPVRLPDCWCCYQPPGEYPEIGLLPALSTEVVTFGSLNNFAKVHEGVLACWARVLAAVEGSKLLMFCPEGGARDRVRAFLGARGIAAERVELAGLLPRLDYLRLYHRIDIGLDPFPYNGMTTTCDALWMGVPVLTLPGEMPVSRAGLSLLSNVGLAEMVASSEEDFVRVAVELAGNLPRLADLRATLRPRMQASPLMDAPRFAGNVEAAYRSMWHRWCAAGG